MLYSAHGNTEQRSEVQSQTWVASNCCRGTQLAESYFTSVHGGARAGKRGRTRRVDASQMHLSFLWDVACATGKEVSQ